MRHETISVCAFEVTRALTHYTDSGAVNIRANLRQTQEPCSALMCTTTNIKYFICKSRQFVNVCPLKKFKYLTLGKGKR